MRPRQEPDRPRGRPNRPGLSRAFDDALTAAGGSLPTWLVVTALKRGDHTMQRDIAATVGIEGATLTHHLNRMEPDGLVERHRDPANRRNQIVALTPAGDAMFGDLLEPSSPSTDDSATGCRPTNSTRSGTSSTASSATSSRATNPAASTSRSTGPNPSRK